MRIDKINLIVKETIKKIRLLEAKVADEDVINYINSRVKQHGENIKIFGVHQRDLILAETDPSTLLFKRGDDYLEAAEDVIEKIKAKIKIKEPITETKELKENYIQLDSSELELYNKTKNIPKDTLLSWAGYNSIKEWEDDNEKEFSIKALIVSNYEDIESSLKTLGESKEEHSDYSGDGETPKYENETLRSRLERFNRVIYLTYVSLHEDNKYKHVKEEVFLNKLQDKHIKTKTIKFDKNNIYRLSDKKEIWLNNYGRTIGEIWIEEWGDTIIKSYWINKEIISENLIKEETFKDNNFKYHEGDKVKFVLRGEEHDGVIKDYDYHLMTWKPTYDIDYEKEGKTWTVMGVPEDQITLIEVSSDEEYQKKLNFNKMIKQMSESKKIKESIELNKYRLTVKHDKGKVRLTTPATSEEDAKKIVMKHEGCPESAIISVEKLNETIIKEAFRVPRGSEELKQVGFEQAEEAFNKGYVLYMYLPLKSIPGSNSELSTKTNLYPLTKNSSSGSSPISTKNMEPIEFGFRNIVNAYKERAIEAGVNFRIYTLFDVNPYDIDNKSSVEETLTEESNEDISYDLIIANMSNIIIDKTDVNTFDKNQIIGLLSKKGYKVCKRKEASNYCAVKPKGSDYSKLDLWLCSSKPIGGLNEDVRNDLYKQQIEKEFPGALDNYNPKTSYSEYYLELTDKKKQEEELKSNKLKKLESGARTIANIIDKKKRSNNPYLVDVSDTHPGFKYGAFEIDLYKEIREIITKTFGPIYDKTNPYYTPVNDFDSPDPIEKYTDDLKNNNLIYINW